MIIGWHSWCSFGEIFMLLLHRLPVPGTPSTPARRSRQLPYALNLFGDYTLTARAL